MQVAPEYYFADVGLYGIDSVRTSLHRASDPFRNGMGLSGYRVRILLMADLRTKSYLL